MKRLLLFLILLPGYAARGKGQVPGPPQDGMRPVAETQAQDQSSPLK